MEKPTIVVDEINIIEWCSEMRKRFEEAGFSPDESVMLVNTTLQQNLLHKKLTKFLDRVEVIVMNAVSTPRR